MRLIDAEALVKKIKEQIDILERDLLLDKGSWLSNIRIVWFKKLLMIIENAPTIEAKPVVHAHWEIEYDEEDNIKKCYCSNCGVGCEPMNNCGFCGAQMDEVASDTNVGSKMNSSEKPNSCDHIAEGGKKESD